MNAPTGPLSYRPFVALRLKPSGHVHLWQQYRDRHGIRFYAARCNGLQRTSLALTANYPPACRHCPDCFPNGIPA